MAVIVVAIENNADIQENKRVPRDTHIGSEQLRYTLWTVKHLNQIVIGYTQKIAFGLTVWTSLYGSGPNQNKKSDSVCVLEKMRIRVTYEPKKKSDVGHIFLQCEHRLVKSWKLIEMDEM